AQPILSESRILELRYAIANRDRGVGARLGVEIARRFGRGAPPGRLRARFEGSAGQRFGGLLAAGVELQLVGEANDYVGKGMGGGVAYVFDPAGTLPLRLNAELVRAERGANDELRELLERHVRHTGSPRAAAVLAEWSSARHVFWRVTSRTAVHSEKGSDPVK